MTSLSHLANYIIICHFSDTCQSSEKYVLVREALTAALRIDTMNIYTQLYRQCRNNLITPETKENAHGVTRSASQRGGWSKIAMTIRMAKI
jgi:hypothetical protein